MENKDAKLVKRQIYTIEVVHFDDGTSVMNRNNDGFSVMELMGLTTLVQSDLKDLFKASLNKPDVINRKSTDAPFINRE